MRFCDFLNILHNNTSYRISKSKFILQLFSALCGEKNPCKANDKYPFSSALPVGLGNDDPKYRSILYGKSARYKGLTDPIRRHIRTNNNKDTFIAYLETVYKNKIADLCDAFEVTKIIKKATIFEGIYEQFMDYANSDNDEATFKLKNVPFEEDIPFEEVFNNSIFSFNVIEFIESDPVESLSPHFFKDMRQFVGRIQQSDENKNTPHKDEKTSCKMIDFSNTLLEYVEYLEEEMEQVSTEIDNGISYMNERYEMPKSFRVKYEPPKDNKDFKNRTLNYRDSLKSLYNEIQSLKQE